MYKDIFFTNFITIVLVMSLAHSQEVGASAGIGVNMNHIDSAQCLLPTKADDRNLIADTVKNIPISKSKLHALRLKRIYSKDKSLSLIVPGSWMSLKSDTKNHYIIQKKERNSPTVNSELLLTKISLGKDFLANYPGVDAIKYYYQNLIGKKAEADVVKPLKYITLPDKIYATFARKVKVDSINVYEYHFLMLQSNILYDLTLAGDKQHSDTSKFLAALGIYSMWTKESCSNNILAINNRAHTKAKNSSNDENLLAEAVKAVPGIEKELSSFKISRNSKKGVSLITAGTWNIVASEDKDTLFALKGYIKGYAYETEISKLSKKDLGNTKGLSKEDIVLELNNALSEKIIKESKRKGLISKVILYPIPEETMGGTVTYTIMKFYKEQAVLWMSIGVIYNGENLYFIISNTENRDSKYIKFFTKLMSESLMAD